MEPAESPARELPAWQRLQQLAGVDAAFLIALMARVTPTIGLLLTTYLIGTRFPKVEQGFFYSFVSLLSLQVFVELGIGQVIVQFSAHEFAHLSFDRHRGFSGEPTALSRLISIARFAGVWFGGGAVLLVVILGVVGYVSFSGHASASWAGPWLTLCLASAFSLALLPVQLLLEGCNQLRTLYSLKTAQLLCNQAGLCVAIILGGGLWSNAIGVFCGAACVILAGIGPLRRFYLPFFSQKPASRLHWGRELWPMQWRVAISSASAYFAYSVVTPLAFRLIGPVIAGQLGMSLTLIDAMTSVACLPVALKRPSMAMAVAHRDYQGLNNIVFRSTFAALLLWCCGAAALIGGVYLLHLNGVPFAERLLPLPLFMLWLLPSMQSPGAGVPMLAYTRAHKQEPFMWSIAVYSLLAFGGYIISGHYYGVVGMAVVNIIALSITTPVQFAILMSARRRWHMPSGAANESA